MRNAAITRSDPLSEDLAAILGLDRQAAAISLRRDKVAAAAGVAALMIVGAVFLAPRPYPTPQSAPPPRVATAPTVAIPAEMPRIVIEPGSRRNDEPAEVAPAMPRASTGSPQIPAIATALPSPPPPAPRTLTASRETQTPRIPPRDAGARRPAPPATLATRPSLRSTDASPSPGAPPPIAVSPPPRLVADAVAGVAMPPPPTAVSTNDPATTTVVAKSESDRSGGDRRRKRAAISAIDAMQALRRQ